MFQRISMKAFVRREKLWLLQQQVAGIRSTNCVAVLSTDKVVKCLRRALILIKIQ